jgi:hypothetical protein
MIRHAGVSRQALPAQIAAWVKERGAQANVLLR